MNEVLDLKCSDIGKVIKFTEHCLHVWLVLVLFKDDSNTVLEVWSDSGARLRRVSDRQEVQHSLKHCQDVINITAVVAC